jgi:predicted ATPase/DNA-binding SARP family transcriptional activator
MTVASLLLLGEPRVVIDGETKPVGSAKQQALLASLVVDGEVAVRVERIIDRLWGGQPPATARKNVQVLVGQLRTLLGNTDAIRFAGDAYVLDRSLVLVDVEEFERLRAAASRHADAGHWYEAVELAETALELWRGYAFGRVRDELWATLRANDLEETRLDVIELHVECELQLGHHDRMTPYLSELVSRHGDRARFHELRIRACAGAGLQAHALEACRDALAALDADESAFVHELQRRILRQDEALLPARLPGGPAPPTVPRSSNEFVGREPELDDLRQLVRDGVRIVTVTGPGGAGKTRLASELARRMHDRFEQVVWLDLTQLREGAALSPMIVRAFGIAGGSEDPLETVARAIGNRRLLVVFDNFEHVLADGGIVQQLADATSRAVFISTSRAPLGMPGEQEYRLASFSIDTGHHADAVALFMGRARAVDGCVDDSPECQSLVRELCSRVDGLPLGIELAAARTALLTPSQLLERLDGDSSILRTRNPAVPARQRSLRDLVAWSYQLLDEGERNLLACVAAFTGPVHVQYLREVVRSNGSDDAVTDELLRSLRHKQLVVGDDDEDGARWALLDTVREFVLDGNVDAETLDAVDSRLLELVRSAYGEGPLAQRQCQELSREISNVLGAIDRALPDAPVRAAQLYGMLQRYYMTRGSYAEGEAYGDRVLQAVGSSTSVDVARAKVVAAVCFDVRGRREEAGRLAGEAIDVFRDAGLHDEELRALLLKVDFLRFAGDTDGAYELVERIRALATLLDQPWALGRASFTIGCLYLDMGRRSESIEEYRRALTLLGRSDDDYWRANAKVMWLVQTASAEHVIQHVAELSEVSEMLLEAGHFAYAAFTRCIQLGMLVEFERYAECADLSSNVLDAASRAGDAVHSAYACANLAYAMLQLGRHAESRTRALQALELGHETSYSQFSDIACFCLASLADLEGDRELASAALSVIDPTLLDLDYEMDRRLDEGIRRLSAELGAKPIRRSEADRLSAMGGVLDMARSRSISSHPA